MIGIGTLALIAAGVWSFTKLPIDAVPDITNNQVQIITLSPTLATAEVEQYISAPIEIAAKTIPDLVELRSISRFGLSVVTVVFDEDKDIWLARQQITEKLKEVEENLPAYAQPLFVRILPKLSTTGTFKVRKQDLMAEGFEPVKGRGPIYYKHPGKGYIKLTKASYEKLIAGQMRL